MFLLEASAHHFWDTWQDFLSEDFTHPRLPGSRICAAAANLAGACDQCRVFNDIFFQVPLETWQSPSCADHRRGGAVAKVTASCPSLLKPHWVCWKSGHTSQWLAAAAVPTTTEHRHGRCRRYIRDWAANQEPSAWTTWQQWQDTQRVRYWRSGHVFCLLTMERWRRPILLTPSPPFLHTSLTFKPRGRPTPQPPLGLDRLMVPVPQTGPQSTGTYGR